MSIGRISNRSVAAFAPNERPSFLWDNELSGFALKCMPSGHKAYIVQYRRGGRRGTTQRITLGKHGVLTPEEARREARRILGVVAAGGDPAHERAKNRQGMTVAELCDLYLAEGCPTKKPSTLATDRGRVLRHIKPLLGRKMIAEVNGADVQRFMQDVAAGKSRTNEKTRLRGRAIVRGGRGTATRTVGLLGGIFTFAMRKLLIDANPVRGVERYKDAKRERYLSAGELARLGSALRQAENEGESRVAVAAIRLLALTGCRKSEILTLKWDYVDIERSCLRLPDSKTGAKVVPLGAPAVELLASLPRIEGSDFVLPALRGSGHFVDVPSAWARIRGKADLSDVRLHDLRHSFASVGAAGGDSLLIIGGLLGHRDPKTTARYAHLSASPLKSAADRISGRIAAALSGTGGDVVVLDRDSNASDPAKRASA